MSFLCMAFANTTFTQSFFGDYDHSTDSSFAYENNSYRDDGKIQKYNNKFSKDDSNSYNCRFDGSGELKCGNYNINTSSKHTDKDAAKNISRHYKKLKDVKDVKDVSKGDDFNCALDDKKDVYCWGDGTNGEKCLFDKPQKVQTDVEFSRLSMATTYTCGIEKDANDLYC
ncbi:Hypothetical protein FNO222_0059 [Francisella orientalis]|nr:hypothetical protein OOM_0057 [Francisella orientalis str. Toba 04]AKN84873.1 hypothetical protein FNO12_0059 [Francisella orientalis FNO12]AKN86411.1 Hypothetical protein FNO24_0059 [Francisella orientalis FNO24]AKN87949.1 Hypothetical protein FNO190_0059 [Francisella orientalis]AKU04703.1 Hypothetical protein FNO01_0059 [Francisella orientalis]